MARASISVPQLVPGCSAGRWKIGIYCEHSQRRLFGELFRRAISDGGAVGGAGLSMDAAAYYSSFDPRIFEFFKIRAVETSSQGTAISVRYKFVRLQPAANAASANADCRMAMRPRAQVFRCGVRAASRGARQVAETKPHPAESSACLCACVLATLS